jgi:hypothetical protein
MTSKVIPSASDNMGAGNEARLENEMVIDDTSYGFPEGVDALLKLPQYGCVVWVDDGTLYDCEANTFAEAGGTVQGAIFADEYGEVTAPQSQAFLDRVNFHLGTDFKMDEFAGR